MYHLILLQPRLGKITISVGLIIISILVAGATFYSGNTAAEMSNPDVDWSQAQWSYYNSHTTGSVVFEEYQSRVRYDDGTSEPLNFYMEQYIVDYCDIDVDFFDPWNEEMDIGQSMFNYHNFNPDITFSKDCGGLEAQTVTHLAFPRLLHTSHFKNVSGTPVICRQDGVWTGATLTEDNSDC